MNIRMQGIIKAKRYPFIGLKNFEDNELYSNNTNHSKTFMMNAFNRRYIIWQKSIYINF